MGRRVKSNSGRILRRKARLQAQSRLGDRAIPFADSSEGADTKLPAGKPPQAEDFGAENKGMDDALDRRHLQVWSGEEPEPEGEEEPEGEAAPLTSSSSSEEELPESSVRKPAARTCRARTASAPCSCSLAHGGAEPSRLAVSADAAAGARPSAGANEVGDVEAAGNAAAETAAQRDADIALSLRPRRSSGSKHVHISLAYETPRGGDGDGGGGSVAAGSDGAAANAAGALAPSAPAAGAGAATAANGTAGRLVTTPEKEQPPQRVVLSPSTTRLIPASEVARHHTCEDCWIVAHSKVYDVTAYIFQHPGGAGAILRNAGGDATEHFDFHPKASQKLWATRQIGVLDRPHGGGGGGGGAEAEGSCVIC